MKQQMTNHTEQVHSTMFHTSGDEVHKSLKGLVQYIEDNLDAKLHELHRDVCHDYRTTLGVEDLRRREIATEWQQNVKRSVKDIIAAGINGNME